MNLMDHSRTLIAITGDEATSFLQGIVTQDMEAAKHAPVFSAMLSAQGKWNDDFFIIPHADGYLLDTHRHTADALVKKLMLYKLRAKVTITRRDDWRMGYAEEGGFADSRHPSLPHRIWVEGEKPMPEGLLSIDHVTAERLRLGIPEGGIDATANETLLDLGYDLLNAVSFTKGCYVGQEVTARMHYKSIARKGFYHVTAETVLPTDLHDITIDDKVVGTLRSRYEKDGLMFARFDAVGHEASAMLGDIPVQLRIPEWLMPRYEMFLKNKEA